MILRVDVNAAETYQGGIRSSNRARLQKLHRDGGEIFSAADAARILDLPQPKAGQLLASMARRGWLSRVRRGVYVAVPLDARRPGEWIEDTWVVVTRLYGPCYIAGWSACEHWGLTEQLFRTLLVVTSRRVRDREPPIKGVHVRLHHRPVDKHFGTVGVWRGQTKVQVSDPTRTIVDVLDDPSMGGGIRTVSDVLIEYLDSTHRDDALLIEYGDRLANRTVFKRLGFLLEVLHAEAPELVEACLARRSAGLGTLDPSVAARGRIVRRWGLRVNLVLHPHEETA
jgi:predicted transcriptional regulator of viral defense system